jgi:hypothetical protein
MDPTVVSHWALMDCISQIQIILWHILHATIVWQCDHTGLDPEITGLIREIKSILHMSDLQQQLDEDMAKIDTEENHWWHWLVCVLFQASCYSLTLLECSTVVEGLMGAVDGVRLMPVFPMYPAASGVLKRFEQPAIRSFILAGLACSRETDSQGIAVY